MVEGEPFEVQELHYREDEEKVAYVKRVDVDYFTDAISAKGVWILRRLEGARRRRVCSPSRARCWWPRRWSASRRSSMGTLENVGSGEVELPQQEMQTDERLAHPRPRRCCAEISPRRDDLVDGLRALSHLLHSLAPIFLLCDIRDLGSWLGDGHAVAGGRGGDARDRREPGSCRPSTSPRRSTSTTTSRAASAWPSASSRCCRISCAAAWRRSQACACASGCPSCVGPVNEVGRRAKPMAARLLDAPRPPALGPDVGRDLDRADAASSGASRPRAGPPGRRRGRARSLEAAARRRGRGDGAGRLLVVRRRFPVDHRHGGQSLLGRRATRRRGPLALLARRRTATAAGRRACSILDTETTGLAGGTGTYAFLVGVGFFDGDDFEVRQFFMRDLDEEPALLTALEATVAGASTASSPTTGPASTCRCSRRASCSAAAASRASVFHLDLLRPRAPALERAARRLPARHASSSTCCGFTRDDDLPGALIPTVYFEYLRRKRPDELPRVFEHNRHDILSLAALTGWVADAVVRAPVPDLEPEALAGLGRLLEPRGPGAEPGLLPHGAGHRACRRPSRERLLLRLAQGEKRARALGRGARALGGGGPRAARLRSAAVGGDRQGARAPPARPAPPPDRWWRRRSRSPGGTAPPSACSPPSSTGWSGSAAASSVRVALSGARQPA